MVGGISYWLGIGIVYTEIGLVEKYKILVLTFLV
jgi:hypothetical protein